MCLAVPAKITALHGSSATVELNGVRQQANVALIDVPALGDYVLVHAGFAIQKWAADEAAAWFSMMREMNGHE